MSTFLSPSLVLPYSCDTSSEVFHEKDILEVIATIIAIDPPTPTIISTPLVDVTSSSTTSNRIPKWDHSTLKDATPFIKDLPPSHCHSTSSSPIF